MAFLLVLLLLNKNNLRWEDEIFKLLVSRYGASENSISFTRNLIGWQGNLIGEEFWYFGS